MARRSYPISLILRCPPILLLYPPPPIHLLPVSILLLLSPSSSLPPCPPSLRPESTNPQPSSWLCVGKKRSWSRVDDEDPVAAAVVTPRPSLVDVCWGPPSPSSSDSSERTQQPIFSLYHRLKHTCLSCFIVCFSLIIYWPLPHACASVEQHCRHLTCRRRSSCHHHQRYIYNMRYNIITCIIIIFYIRASMACFHFRRVPTASMLLFAAGPVPDERLSSGRRASSYHGPCVRSRTTGG